MQRWIYAILRAWKKLKSCMPKTLGRVQPYGIFRLAFPLPGHSYAHPVPTCKSEINASFSGPGDGVAAFRVSVEYDGPASYKLTRKKLRVTLRESDGKDRFQHAR